MLNVWQWFSSHKFSLGSHVPFSNPTRKSRVVPINRKFSFLSRTFKDFCNLGVETWENYGQWEKGLAVPSRRRGIAKMGWKGSSGGHTDFGWRRKVPHGCIQSYGFPLDQGMLPWGSLPWGHQPMWLGLSLTAWQLCFYLLYHSYPTLLRIAHPVFILYCIHNALSQFNEFLKGHDNNECKSLHRAGARMWQLNN